LGQLARIDLARLVAVSEQAVLARVTDDDFSFGVLQDIVEPSGVSACLGCHFDPAAEALEEVEDSGGAGLDDRLHHELASGVEDGDADTCLVNVESDIVVARKGSPFGGNLPSFENSEATTKGDSSISQ
jgi:hypothetical protein